MTPIELCNRALTEIGAETIADFGTTEPKQKACQLVYAPCRDELLEMHPWHFALKRRVLALTDETVTDYLYAYSWPSDAMTIWDVRVYVDATGDDELIWEPYQIEAGRNKFEIVVNANLTGKLIACDIQDAEAIYTAQVTNPTLYSSVFCAALVYLIAMRLCPKLATEAGTLERVTKMYMATLRAATSHDARHGSVTPEDPNPYVEARS